MGSTRLALIVEDHPPIRDLIQKQLNAAGVRTHAVADGAEALWWLTDHVADVVITDYIMPQLNGLELTRAMRQTLRTASIPVILLTAVDTPAAHRRAREVGVDGVVHKPFKKKGLVDTVAAAIDRSRLARQNIRPAWALRPIQPLSAIASAPARA